MTLDQWIALAGIVAIIAVIAVVLWLCIATANEAERRLGRDLYLIEIIIAGAAFPYSLAMVWFAMPDKSQRSQ